MSVVGCLSGRHTSSILINIAGMAKIMSVTLPDIIYHQKFKWKIVFAVYQLF
jgi:hypothetical protein